MRILNLSKEDLPTLQGVHYVSTDTTQKCLDVIASKYDSDRTAGDIRGLVKTEAYLHKFKSGDDSLITALHNQDPVLVVLNEDGFDIAESILHMQIGPEPGTTIPLLVPVLARNRRWFYFGNSSELRMEVAFNIDQNGNVAGLTNFVHVTPKLTGAQIEFLKYECAKCNFIYDEALGFPEDNIPPYTKFEDLPQNWSPPNCEATKEDFVEIA